MEKIKFVLPNIIKIFIFFLIKVYNIHREVKKILNVKTVSSSIVDSKIPKHLAVIMDGNRRFGMKTHSDPLKGHFDGRDKLLDFTQWCMEEGVEILTVYAFSTENWNRNPKEVESLMNIFLIYAEKIRKEGISRNIKIQVLSSDDTKFPNLVKTAIRELERDTAKFDGIVVNLCFSYGGRGDIVNASKSIANSVKKENMNIDDINEEIFSSHLSTKNIPDPELLIRTSGEYRLSNFLLWELAYTEMFFIDKFWPEVNREDLLKIFREYSERKRRYGK